MCLAAEKVGSSTGVQTASISDCSVLRWKYGHSFFSRWSSSILSYARIKSASCCGFSSQYFFFTIRNLPMCCSYICPPYHFKEILRKLGGASLINPSKPRGHLGAKFSAEVFDFQPPTFIYNRPLLPLIVPPFPNSNFYHSPLFQHLIFLLYPIILVFYSLSQVNSGSMIIFSK